MPARKRMRPQAELETFAPARKRMRLETFAPNASIESLPSEVMKNIFNFVGKGNYCFIAPVSKDFCYNYLTMDVIEDSCNHRMDYLLATQRNRITTTEAASTSSETAEHCFLYAPDSFQGELCAKAASKGRKDIVTMADSLGVDFKCFFKDSLKHITEKGDLEMLKLLEDDHLPWGTFSLGEIVGCAALHGHLDILKWLHKSKKLSTENGMARSLFEKASQNGHLKIIQWATNHFDFEAFMYDYMNNAAKGGQLELVKWFRRLNISWHFETLMNAVHSGNKELIEYLLFHGDFCNIELGICRAVVVNVDKKIALESLMYMHQLGIPWDETTCSSAAANGIIDALIYARNNGCTWDGRTLADAVQNNHVDVVKYCLENRCPVGTSACTNAVLYLDCCNALKMLKLLRQYSVPWDVKTCTGAAMNGYFEALKFARSRGCPWNEETFQSALRSKDITTIQYCIENGCPFDNAIYKDIISQSKNSVRILKLLQKNGHELTEDACAAAAAAGGFRGDIKVLRWLRYIGCPWDERICHEAVKGYNYNLLVYAHENGCPWTKETFAYCFSENGLGGVYQQIPNKSRHDEIFNYLRENNCPQPDASDWQIVDD
ncbi:hypothetical protein CTEN210_05393 [Chaetoceros tenuissimus]|uniref:Uncharacterized protein n=1 Tax=Chaetoceros tenuissimus TaxID=426638 RepID=A0AAD3H374_9STRA|nr:hypothetical protein CTEN210_05393 [Chaetoceros tenuissimus]